MLGHLPLPVFTADDNFGGRMAESRREADPQRPDATAALAVAAKKIGNDPVDWIGHGRPDMKADSTALAAAAFKGNRCEQTCAKSSGQAAPQVKSLPRRSSSQSPPA